MKTFVILWAIGLAACDKLDRTYLPPPGSIMSGGQPSDLNLPLEYPRGNYPSTLASGIERKDSELRPNYPNVAIGIAESGPTSTESLATESRVPSNNVFNVPSTISPYAFTQTTTLAPVESYETTVGSVSPQRYPSPISTLEPGMNNPSFLMQQIENSGSSQQFVPTQNQGIGQAFAMYPNGTIKKTIETGNVPGSYRFNHPLNKYRGDLDSISEERASSTRTSYPDYYDAHGSVNNKPYDNQFHAGKEQYTSPQTSANPNAVNVYSKEFSGSPSTLAPQQYSVSSTPGTVVSSYSDDLAMYPFINNAEINRPERIQAQADRNAVIINYENLLTPEGYEYSYDTSNGIHADESGIATDGVKAQGSFSYIGDDGEIYRIVYTADERGFIPRGDHLPTAPPIPKAIVKVIEEAEKNRQLGIIDDGSYDDSKYGHGRYQGIIGRIPQEQYENLIRKQQGIKNNSLRGDKYSYEIENLPADETSLSTKRPFNADNSYGINSENNSYAIVESNGLLPNANKYSNNDLLNSQAIQGINNQLIYQPEDKSTIIPNIIRGPIGINREQSVHNNPGKDFKYSSMIDVDEENSNTAPHQGYRYTRPQNEFNQNLIQSISPNSNGEVIEITLANENNEGVFPTSVKAPIASANFESDKNEYSYSNTQPLTNTNNHPVTVVGKPSSTYDGTHNNRIRNRIFSTRDPISASTTLGPYDFASPSTLASGTKQQEYQYSSSTTGPQYASTTSMPTRYFSQSKINGVRYSQKTPSTLISSTLRPISSTTSVSASRRPAYTVSTSEPYVGFGSSTVRPTSSVSRINEKPGYHGSTQIPETIESGNDPALNRRPSSYSQNKETTRIGFADPGSQRRRIPSQPVYGGQSPTERVIGEDFSGPKQTQRYDPKRGYYY